jgi:hypothetical protein
MSTSKQLNELPADDTILSFLLGRLDAAEQKKFEEQLMTDDRLHERVRQAELQLADGFAGDRIDRLDRQRFSKTFILSGERRRMLAVSAALHQRFSPAADPRHTPALRKSWRSMFNRPALRFALGAIILVLLIGSLWVVKKEPNLVRRFLPKRAPSRPVTMPTPQEANHPSNSAPPVHRDSAPSTDGHEFSEPNQSTDRRVVTTLALAPGSLSDPNQTPAISLPADAAGVVSLELAVEQNTSGEFQAELLTNGNAVFASNSLKTGGTGLRLEFDVPVQTLNVGDYEVRLSRVTDGSKQTVANYYFRVLEVR